MEQLINGVQVALVVALTIESIVEILKSLVQGKKLDKVVLLSIVVGIFVTFTTRLDIYEIVGIETYIPYAGIILSGVLLSRGSNFVHNFFDRAAASSSSSIVINPSSGLLVDGERRVPQAGIVNLTSGSVDINGGEGNE